MPTPEKPKRDEWLNSRVILNWLFRYEERTTPELGMTVEEKAALQGLPATATTQFRDVCQVVDWLKELRDSRSPDDSSLTTSPLKPLSPETIEFTGDGGRVGKFALLGVIGHGSHGVVYLARDTLLNRQVALKLLKPAALVTAGLQRRFQNEGQAAGRLTHPNIVTTYEFGSAGAFYYLVQSYCPGITLREWLVQMTEPVPYAAAAWLVSVLSDAIDYAHEQGILHRDIKPSNVMLEPVEVEEGSRESSGELPQYGDAMLPYSPKLLDFGLAKLLEPEPNSTVTDGVVGTAAYMSPEQASGQPVGKPSDVYSLGAVLYEVLTRRPPLVGHNQLETIQRVLNETPDSVRHLRRDVPPALDAICFKCLQKQPDLRYATAGELASDLRRFLRGEAVNAKLPPTVKPRRWRLPQNKRPLFIGVIIFLVICLSAAKITERILNLQNDVIAVTRQVDQHRAETTSRNARRYPDDMNHAYVLLSHSESTGLYRAHATERARAIMDEYIPKNGEDDLRGFEWQYLRRILNPAKFSPKFPRLHTIQAHTGPAYYAAFSHDGRLIATAGKDGTGHIWNAETGEHVASLTGHTDEINCIEFSPDDQLLVTGSDDGSIRLWKAGTGASEGILYQHDSPVVAALFHPVHNRVVAGTQDGRFLVLDVLKRKLLKAIRAHEKRRIESMAFSGDGSHLASVGDDSRLRIWRSINSIVPVAVFDAPDAEAVAFSHNGRYVAAGAVREVKIFEVPTSRYLAHIDQLPHVIRSLRFTPDDTALVIAGADTTTNLFDFVTGELWNPMDVAKQMWFGVCSPDGRRLATTDGEGRLSIWDSSSRVNFHSTIIGSRNPHFSRVVAAADGERIALISGEDSFPDGSVPSKTALSIWDVSSHDPQLLMEVEPTRDRNRFERVAISRDGNNVLYSEFDPSTDLTSIKGIDLKSSIEHLVVSEAPFSQHSLLMSDTLPIVASSEIAQSKRVRFWGYPDGEIVGMIRTQELAPAMAASSTKPVIAIAANQNRQIGLFKFPGLEPIAACDSRIQYASALLFTRNSQFLIARCQNYGVYVFDATTGEKLRQIPIAGIKEVEERSIAISPDDRTLAVGTQDGIVLIHFETGKIMGQIPFPAPVKYVADLAFVCNGKTLVASVGSSEKEATVILWTAN